MARSNRKKSTPKTISAPGITGQRGINAIEQIVLASGSRWTASGPNEIGIDGYIEMFDPATHRPLGLTLAVQSKVVSTIATNNAPTFNYSCDPNDISYWLQGNVPVVLVVSSGDPAHTYSVPIREHFKNWKPGDSNQITFIKAEHKLDQHSFPRLAAIAAPKVGLYSPPCHKPETLFTNLLPLELYPPSISIAHSTCRSVHDIWTSLRARGGEDVDGGWMLWEKKILSFHDLGKFPWSSVCDLGTLEEFSTEEWSNTEDPQKQRIFVQLLNLTLKAQLYPDVRYWPREDCYAVHGQPHKQSYRSVKRASKVSVITHKTTTSKDGRTFERYRHLAFRGQFRRLDSTWFLEITPTYRFTSDGVTLDHFHEENLKGIKALEGNRAVLSSVMLWADYLQPKTNLFTRDPSPLQFGKLLTFHCDIGINDADWKAVDPNPPQELGLFPGGFFATVSDEGAES
jgi:uncharacterized protein DUF4365